MNFARTAARILVVAALCFTGCAPPAPPPKPPAAAPEPAPPSFSAVADGIFAAYFAAHPVTATALGEHAYDSAWPDLSPEAVAADRQRIDDAVAALAVFDALELSADEKVDLAVLRNALELQRFEHEVDQPWARDPFWYAGIVGTGLDDLVSRDFAPIDERAASVATRLEQLPAFLDQAKATLDPPNAMLPQTDVAIGQLDGVVELVRTVIPTRIAEAPEDVRARIGAATGPAIQGLRAFQQDLRMRVRPNASGKWRLGKANFERKLALTLNADLGSAELRRVAVVEHGRVRKKMAQLAYKLAGVVFTKSQLRKIQRRASGRDVDSAVVAAVLAELGANHTTPPALRDSIETTLGRLNAFVAEQKIVPLDEGEQLQVIWTPPHQRGVFIAGLAAPGPLEAAQAGLPSFYLVQPLPKAWTAEVTESYLREYNNFMLEILSIHEAIPGHFVQAYYAKRDPSKIRRVFGSNPFIEGWAVYTEKVMVDEGYYGIGPDDGAARPSNISPGLWRVMTDDSLRGDAIALHGLKFYLRSVTNAILDHAVHTTNMSRQEAIELMVERSFQQEGEAVQKWVRAQVTACQLSTYFVGAQAWLRLRKKAEARARDAGAQFDLSAFHAEALSHGAPPVHTLPDLMGWNAPAPEASAPAPEAEDAATPAAEAPAPASEDAIEIEPEADPQPDSAAAPPA